MGRVLDRFLLCGQSDGQTFAVWTEGWTDICRVDRGLDRLFLCGQRIGGWQRVALILAVWTKDWRLCGQSGVYALPVWTEWWAGPSGVDRRQLRLFIKPRTVSGVHDFSHCSMTEVTTEQRLKHLLHVHPASFLIKLQLGLCRLFPLQTVEVCVLWRPDLRPAACGGEIAALSTRAPLAGRIAV